MDKVTVEPSHILSSAGCIIYHDARTDPAWVSQGSLGIPWESSGLAKNICGSSVELLQNADNGHVTRAKLVTDAPPVLFDAHSDCIFIKRNENGFTKEYIDELSHV